MSRATPLLIALMGATVLFAVACSTAKPTPTPNFNLANLPSPSMCNGGFLTDPLGSGCPPQITLSEWGIARTDIPAHNHVEITPAGGVKVATEGKPGHQHDPPRPDHPLILWALGSTGNYGELPVRSFPYLQGNGLWLEVRNSGSRVHRLAIWRGGQVIGERIEGGSLVAETDFLQPGEIVRLWIYWEKDEYVLNDPMPGHTEKGMHLRIAAKEPPVTSRDGDFDDFDPSGDG